MQSRTMAAWQSGQVQMLKELRFDCDGDTTPECPGFCAEAYLFEVVDECVPPPLEPVSRQEEIGALRQTASDLRRQLAEVMDRLEKLEKD